MAYSQIGLSFMNKKIQLISLILIIPILFLSSCKRYKQEMLMLEPKDFEYEEKLTIEPPKFDEFYKLGIGDKLTISVMDQEGSEREVVVDSKGYISYLYIDSVYAKGLSIDELKETIQKEMSDIFIDAIVSIKPTKLVNYRVYIYGEVTEAKFTRATETGERILPGPSRITDVLAMIGKFKLTIVFSSSVPTYDIDKMTIIRDNRVLPINFKKLLEEGDMSQNIYVQNGDIIYVPKLQYNRLYLIGNFVSPGSISYFGNTSLTKAIAYGKGLRRSSKNKLLIIRGSIADPEIYEINLSDIIHGKVKDPLLRDGDIIYAPTNPYAKYLSMVEQAFNKFTLNNISTYASVQSGTYVPTESNGLDENSLQGKLTPSEPENKYSPQE